MDIALYGGIPCLPLVLRHLVLSPVRRSALFVLLLYWYFYFIFS